MKLSNQYAASVFACLLVLGGCSAKVETSGGGGTAPQPDHLRPVNELVQQLQGAWQSACVAQNSGSMKKKLNFDGDAVDMTTTSYFDSADCTGSNMEIPLHATVIVGAASKAVVGATDVDFDLGGMRLLNVLRLEGDTLYLGEDAVDPRPTALKMDLPFTRVR